MIITGIRGTELESIFKQFYEQMISEQKEMFQMIKEFTGVDPDRVRAKPFRKLGYACLWDYDEIMFPEGSNPKNMTFFEYGKTYSPNRALQESTEFMNQWHNKFKGIDGKVLSNYGIPVVFDFRYFHWEPVFYNGKYGIKIPEEIKRYLFNIEDKQYEIE